MITFRALGQRGRLGNQLFQFAATCGIAWDNGINPLFPASWIYRPYFSVPSWMFEDELPAEAVESTQFAQHLDPRCRDYLQDFGLFSHHLDKIVSFLEPSDLARRMLKEITWWPKQGVLAVHVRRGDNVFDPGVPNKSDYHLVPPLSYYNAGINLLQKDQKLAVFSDDIPWCREFIPADFYGDGRAYLKEHEPDYGVIAPLDWIDLFAMSWAQSFVLSGSTFGIWGALLSGCFPENVVRPNRVYGPALDHIDSELLFPPSWRVQCF